MKKAVLRAQVAALRDELEQERVKARYELAGVRQLVKQLTAEVERMRHHWRPVPIAHPWQPKNPQCALCDEPKDSPRHGDAM